MCVSDVVNKVNNITFSPSEKVADLCYTATLEDLGPLQTADLLSAQVRPLS